MPYEILRTDKAADQLHELIQYIFMDSGSAEIALTYLAKIEHAVSLLADQPNLGRYPRYSILKKQGYRVLIVEKHLILYKVDEERKNVLIYAFVGSRQEYLRLV